MPTIAQLLSAVSERMSVSKERRAHWIPASSPAKYAVEYACWRRATALSCCRNADGEILRILSYAVLTAALGCGGTDATGESGFSQAGAIRIEEVAAGD